MAMTKSFPQSRCRVGVSTGDITPPVGIYHRMWGAARHDRSTGVHRPLQQTTVAMASIGSPGATDAELFISVDHCLFWAAEMQELRQAISADCGLPVERITVFFTHTHGAGLLGHERSHLPGGEFIDGYLQQLGQTLAAAGKDALAKLQPATIVYGTGRCNLACNRDLLDETTGQYVCGYSPDGVTDDTLLIGRVTADGSDESLLTVVNYACHPTTLAWDNTLISPDFLGAFREVIEQRTGAPTLFIQGASGDIGPREGFVGDVAVADRNGRQLGYAVLSAWEDLPPAGMRFEYTGAVVSGATIGTWKYAPVDEPTRCSHERWLRRRTHIDLPYRDDLPLPKNLQRDLESYQQKEQQAIESGDNAAQANARAMIERCNRLLTRAKSLPDGKAFPYTWDAWLWGDAVWIAVDGEHYNVLQRRLRAHFAGRPIILGTLANGSTVWYLPDRDSFGRGLYQEAASILRQGSLEALERNIIETVESLLAEAIA